jgi:hypothetical protein
MAGADMSRWRIYYSASTFDGETQQDWEAAPSTDVQVIVVFEPRPEPPNLPDRFTTGFVFTHRQDVTFYTGIDDYDPLNYGSFKSGSLLSDTDYLSVWEQAYG